MKKKQEDLRTKKRSDIRLMLGGWYYTWRRYIGWYTSKRQFAMEVRTIPMSAFSIKVC